MAVETSFETIRFDLDAGVARVTLDRGDGMNAISHTLARELMEVAALCDGHPEVRAVLLLAAGRNFCVGGDLKSFAAAGDDLYTHLKERTTFFSSAMSRLARGRAPVVSGVHGFVIGGGLILGSIADIVLAARSTSFSVGFTRLGLTPDGGTTYLLPRLVGLRRALDLTLTNRTFGAEEAVAMGLATRVVDDDRLAVEAEAEARRLAEGPTLAYGAARGLLRASFEQSFETQLELENRAIADASRTADGREGVAAFMARRQPRYNGR
jgi:2-(1,2-epoxy-1,2-dihydrophenyl)acetyl-CoA isomerase